MKRIKSKSDKRLIIEVNINSKKALMLIDTGASVGLIDKDKKKEYNLIIGRSYNGTLIGAGGELKNVKHCDTIVDFEGRKIPQFLITDISSIIKSIKKETGFEIIGIISLPQCKIAHIGIDCDDMDIILE